MRQRLKVVPFEKGVLGGDTKRRRKTPSLKCLPALIAEIDGLDSEPAQIKTAYLIAKYRVIELAECSTGNMEIAPGTITEYLIDVLWRTRGDRHPEKAKMDPDKWPRLERGRREGSGKWIRKRRRSNG